LGTPETKAIPPLPQWEGAAGVARELELATDEADKMRQEVDALSQERDELLEQLEGMEAEKEEMRRENELRRQEVERLQKYREFSSEVESLRREVSRVGHATSHLRCRCT
jgi:uncharacterized coiled-coil DUF342 family protein